MKGMITNMYILATISYINKTTEIDFPISDNTLERILRDSGMPTDTTLQFGVENIQHPEQLSVLNGITVNLDELNYLAKRLDSFDEREIQQFYVALDHESPQTLKDLINLSLNLDKFTLIQDISDMTKVGKDYTINTEGSVPADSRYDEKYAEIGRELLNSGKGIFTDKGLLFVEDKPIEEVYDGQVFPAFAYNPCVTSVDIEYNGKCETVFLPDSDLAIEKAVSRLGAPFLEDCKYTAVWYDPQYEMLIERFDDVLSKEGITELNHLVKKVDEYDIDIRKLAVAIEYTEVSSAHDIGVLIDNIDDLEMIEDVSYGDNEAVGRYFIDTDCYEEYEISDELQDFFDFAEFGEYIAEEKSGQFVTGGFIYYDGCDDISVILDQLDGEDNSMTMGGM